MHSSLQSHPQLPSVSANNMSAELQQCIDFLVEKGKKTLHVHKISDMPAIENQAKQATQKEHKRMELRQKLEKRRAEKLFGVKIKILITNYK